MPNVRCVMMQKDEADLLEAWFKYYGYLFGFGNLEVADNGSTDRSVLDILARYEAVGCTIHRQYQTAEDFLHKGQIVTSIIEGWDRRLDYDLALPIDCDEFLVYFKDNEFRCDREGLHRYLDSLVHIRGPGVINQSLMNVPGEPGWFYIYGVPKTLLSAGTVEHLDNGFHYPRVKSGAAPVGTDLMYVHLHNRPFEKLLRFSRQKLSHFVDVDDMEAVRSYNGNSYHVAKYLLMTPDDYSALYSESPTLFLPEIADLFTALGIDLENTLHGPIRHSRSLREAGSVTVRLPGPGQDVLRRLKSDRYLQAHPDVAYSNMHPLEHYSAAGFREGRSLSDEVQ